MEDPRLERLTLADYTQLPDDGKRYEILEGILEVTPSPDYVHQSISGRLYLVLGNYLEKSPSGQVISAPMDVIFCDDTICQPDLLYIRQERIPQIVSDRVRGAPDLIVEILSPTTCRRDLHTKKQVYARHAVPEYWVINPIENSVLVFRLVGKAYDAGLFCSLHESFESLLFPGLELKLPEIFPPRK